MIIYSSTEDFDLILFYYLIYCNTFNPTLVSLLYKNQSTNERFNGF